MISRQDAAELLDCKVQTVTNWVERGLLKGHESGCNDNRRTKEME